MHLLLVHWFSLYLIIFEGIIISELNACARPVGCYFCCFAGHRGVLSYFLFTCPKILILYTLVQFSLVLLQSVILSASVELHLVELRIYENIWRMRLYMGNVFACLCVGIIFKIGETFWSSHWVQLDLIVGEWPEAWMYTVTMKENQVSVVS